MTLQNNDFFDSQSAHKAPTYQVLSLSSLLQMANDRRMVNVEFFKILM